MQTFGQQNLLADTVATFTTGVAAGGYMRVRNESIFDLTCDFVGQGTCTIGPWARDDILLTRDYRGQLNITPANNSNQSGAPSAYVVVDLFNAGELEVPIPVALTRLTSIGNTADINITSGSVSITGSVVVSNATEVTNETSAAGNSIVFAYPAGDSLVTGATNIKNNGQAIFGDANYPGGVTVQKNSVSMSINPDQIIFNDLAGMNSVQIVAAQPVFIELLKDDNVTLTQLNLTNLLFTDAAGTETVFLNATNVPYLQLQDDSAHQMLLAPTNVHATGSTSGTVDLYQYFQGSFKRTLIFWNNLKGNALTLTFPIAYASGAFFQISDTVAQSINFKSNGVTNTCSVQATISATGGTNTAETNVFGWSQGAVHGGFNQLTLNFTTNAAGGFALIEGV
jgi:hypothetical protein